METEKRICGICAWRRDCQKRFKTSTDAFLNINCVDFTRDLSIKEIPFQEVEDEKTAIARMVAQQVKKWRARMEEDKSKQADVESHPVITISREPGAGASDIARKLSRELSLDLMSSQIIQHVAESAKMSRQVIESLDEKEVTRRDSWMTALFRDRHLWPDEYLQHLTKVIGTIGRYGNAIIVGRGANYILPKTVAFRVRIIAPLEDRIHYVMEDRKCTKAEAEQYVLKTENNRKAFVRKYFNADVTDPVHYDIVINTGGVTIEGATEAIKAAFQKRRFRPS